MSNTGGPAFPMPGCAQTNWPGNVGVHGGMTLRDYFAAKAMQSIRSGPEWQLLEMKTIAAENGAALEIVIAAFAYKQADAMLTMREVEDD